MGSSGQSGPAFVELAHGDAHRNCTVFWGSAWAQASTCGRQGTGTSGTLAQMAGLLVVREAFSPRARPMCISAAHSWRGVDGQMSQRVVVIARRRTVLTRS